MGLKRSQLILILLVTGLTVWLTWAGYKSKYGEQKGATKSDLQHINLEAMVNAEKENLSDSLKKQISQMEGSQEGLVKLIVLWDSLGKSLPAAITAGMLAEKRNTDKDWLIAGSRLYNLAMMSNDSNLMAEAGSRARVAFEAALKLNPTSLDAKNALAACYVDVDHDVMKGVAMLREVIKTDSNNIQALFTLGMLSVQSGQLDKAKARFERLIELQPFNAEMYYYLGDIYARSGDKEKAIATYEKCKTLLSDKEAKKEIESLINKLKTI